MMALKHDFWSILLHNTTLFSIGDFQSCLKLINTSVNVIPVANGTVMADEISVNPAIFNASTAIISTNFAMREEPAAFG